MKIFITGGTGFVGRTLTAKLIEKGVAVTVLTRSVSGAARLGQGVNYVEGDPTSTGPWQDRVAEHDVIINLAGSSIFSRWTEKAKGMIRDSRILTTRHLVNALAAREGRETLLLSTSAVGYYGFHGDEELDENSPPGDDFLATLAGDWEAEAFRAKDHGIRVVTCRFGIVLGRRGGALERMVRPFKKWMGSPLGNGKQWLSWIHEEDLVRIYLFLIEKEGISGALNCTAPEPVRNRDLTLVLGEVLHKPIFLPPVPGLALRLVMGEFGSTLLKGQKVLPKRLLEKGFKHTFPTLREALMDLLGYG